MGKRGAAISDRDKYCAALMNALRQSGQYNGPELDDLIVEYGEGNGPEAVSCFIEDIPIAAVHDILTAHMEKNYYKFHEICAALVAYTGTDEPYRSKKWLGGVSVFRNTKPDTLMKIVFHDERNPDIERTVVGTYKSIIIYNCCVYAMIGHPLENGRTNCGEMGMSDEVVIVNVLPPNDDEVKRWTESYTEFHESVLKYEGYDYLAENLKELKILR